MSKFNLYNLRFSVGNSLYLYNAISQLAIILIDTKGIYSLLH